jgi:hypothetical protein
MKSNPTPTSQITKTDDQVPTAAHMNLDELNISGTHYKDDRKLPEITTPSTKIKNNPGRTKFHQDDKFTTDGNLKTSMVKNKPRLNLSNRGEKLSADGETLKTSNRDLKVVNISGNNDPIQDIETETSQTKFDSKRGKVKPDVEESSNYHDNIKARQILNRLDTDDNRLLLTSTDESILSDDFACSQVIYKQINRIQSGSVRETTVRISKFKSTNNNWNSNKLTPTKTRDDIKLKPIYSTDRLNPKITQPINSQPQGSEPEKTRLWMNHESYNQRDNREIKSGPVKKSAKVDKSKPSKRSMNTIKSLALLQQSYTEISRSSDEEETKEYRVARSKVHLRPGRLKRPG